MADSAEKKEKEAIVMVCDLRTKRNYVGGKWATMCVKADIFFSHPVAASAYFRCWQAQFHSPHKHYSNIRRAKLVIAASGWEGPCTRQPLLSLQEESDFCGFALIAQEPNPEIPLSVQEVMTVNHMKGQGVAKAVMLRLLSEAEATGASAIQLDCVAEHVPMYEKYGFRRQ